MNLIDDDDCFATYNINLKGRKMKFHTKKFSTIIIISLLALIMTSAVHADVIPSAPPVKPETPEATSVKDGTYIGVFVTLNQMSGDFDASTFYTAPGEFYDVPDVDDGTGLGVVLGFRVPNAKWAGEFGYQRSRHDTSSFFIDMGENEASYNVIDLNFKIDVLARDKIRPYILFGFGFPWLTIEDRGMIDGSTYQDVTYLGLCLNVGAGAAYYFRPDLAVTGGLIYRWNRFSSAEGKKLDDALIEKALCFRIGVNYTF